MVETWILLKIYLAFSLAGALVTYWTVLKEAADIYESITEEKHEIRTKPGRYFLTWVIAGTIMAPGLFIVLVTNSLDILRSKITVKWLTNAGYND